MEPMTSSHPVPFYQGEDPDTIEELGLVKHSYNWRHTGGAGGVKYVYLFGYGGLGHLAQLMNYWNSQRSEYTYWF